MAKERITNSFEGGMNSDLDPKLRQPNTYEMSINGRIVYNQDGTLSWETANGNVEAITGISNDEEIIGSVEFPEFVILFMLNTVENESKLKYVRFNETGSGTVHDLFRSSNIAEDKLDFDVDYPIKAKAFIESKELMRVYWTDNKNEPRVFTFKDIGTNIVELEAITESVFQTAITPDWNMPDLTYQGLVDGSLRTGVYQYAVRFITVDGYQTPWSPIGYPIIVTGAIPKKDESSTYGMKDVDIIGNTGTLLRIGSIDRRYDSYEIAYVHTIASTGAKEAGIAITGTINKTSTQAIVERHISIENSTPLALEELYDLKDVILKAKTIEIHDNRLWFGNTQTKESFSIPDEALENVTVTPIFRGLVADKAGNLIHRYGDSKSTVNPDFIKQNFVKRKFKKSSGYVNVPIKDIADKKKEYSNYQSSVICNQFTGYFRGETYRFAAVFFDKKGYPFFADHLADVKMPLFTSPLGNGDNFLTYQRINSRGIKSLEGKFNVGYLGGIPTETKDNWTTVTSAGVANRRLFDKTAGFTSTGTGEDAIVSSGKYTDTKLIHNVNDNHEDFDDYNPKGKLTDPKTNEQYGDTHNPVASRILGLKFSGINLDATLDDGTKLRDNISGMLIVRAERTGADEQVKDMGAVFNAIEGYGSDYIQDYTVDGKKASHINPFIFTGGEPDDPTSVESKDPLNDKEYSIEGLNIIDAAEQNLMGRPIPSKNLMSFDGVNLKVANQTYTLKPNSRIRLDYICDLSNVETTINTGDDLDLPILQQAGLVKKLWSDRHFITKNLNTFNENTTYDDLPYSVICGVLNDINGLIVASTPTNKYGNIANRVVTTNTWLSLYDNNNEYKNMIRRVYQIFEEYNGNSNRKFVRGVATKTLLLNTDIEYVLALGRWNHVNVSGNTDSRIDETMKHSSFYVASIVEENDAPYGGLNLNALQNTRFHTTGTFLTIDEIESESTLNEVEVWGGDCYLDLFSYARILPYLEARTKGEDVSCIASNQGVESDDEEGWDGREFRDYSHGIVVPLQSKYNFRLTYKNSSDGVPTYEEVLTANGATIGGAANFTGEGESESYDLERADKSYYNASSLNGLYFMDGDTCPKVYDNFQIQDALLYNDKVRSYATKPVDFIETTKHPTRWHWSNLKQPYNAKIDKFRQFEEISNFDLDGIYGGITGAILMFDQIYSIQEKGFGRLRSSDRAVLNSGELGDLLLGESGVMDGIDYISKVYGTQYWQSIVTSGKSFYFVDARMAKIVRFGQDGVEPISDSKGIHNFIEPYLKRLSIHDGEYNIVSGYDFNNNDVYITIKGTGNDTDYRTSNTNYNWNKIEKDTGNRSLPDEYDIREKTDSITLLYNDIIQGFHGIHTIYPKHYMNFGDRLYVTKQNGRGNLYLNGKGEKGSFYDEYYYSMLRYNVNKFPNLTKIYDNTAWNVNDDALSKIGRVSAESEGVTHTYSNLSSVIANIASSYSVNNRAKYREGLLRFPLREVDGFNKPRLRGKNMSLELWVENDTENKKFSLTSIDTVVRF
jgi:hypothetical protein